MLDNKIAIKQIVQTYLVKENEHKGSRVRKTFCDGLTSFHFNEKKLISLGTNEEIESEISFVQYEEYLKNKDPNKRTIEKTRFVFNYKNQIFELDVFKGPLKGLVVLEIELKNINESVHLPPYLKILKEVTNDKKYSNSKLAESCFIKFHYE